MKRSNPFYKVICFIIIFVFMVNQISFASSELKSCLAPPNGFNSPCTIHYDSSSPNAPIIDERSSNMTLLKESPLIFTWHLIASALFKGLTPEQTKNLISETVVKRFKEKDILYPYDWRNIQFDTFTSGKIDKNSFVLSVIGKDKAFIFTKNEESPSWYHLDKFECEPGKFVFLNIRDIDKPEKPEEETKTVVTKETSPAQPEKTPELVTHKVGETKDENVRKKKAFKTLNIQTKKTILNVIAIIAAGAYVISAGKLDILLALPIILVSLTIHEYAHAWTANKFGDDTAKRKGRLTLNPLAHISLIGTVIMPILVRFGWAKPVPVNFTYLSKRQKTLTALAGPAANLSLAAVLSGIFLIFGSQISASVSFFLMLSIQYNLILGIFNLLPISPLDGGIVFPLKKLKPIFARIKTVILPVIALLGVPLIMLICDREYYLEELRRQREQDAQNENDADMIAEEIESELEEMGDLLDELAEAMEEEGEDDLDSEIDEAEKHDIRDVTIRSVVRYLRSGKKDKSFEELLSSVAGALQKGPLNSDDLRSVEGLLGKDKTNRILKEIYDKADKTIKPLTRGDNGTREKKDQSKNTLLTQKLQRLTDHLTKGGHHHHIIWITFGILRT